ncbi:MAG: ribosome silencing factor [Lachnospiraceae bacterium]|nr:ribosome silencing factor [Lachnospiraceae bacterium]
MTEAYNTVLEAVNALNEKKAADPVVIDISGISIMADYFVIATGKNVNQLQAMCENVRNKLAKKGIMPRQTEGYDTANWILMDYGDVIIHIFDEESRSFYDLERIWSDGKDVAI